MLGNSATLKVFSSWSLELHAVMFSPQYINLHAVKQKHSLKHKNIILLFEPFSRHSDCGVLRLRLRQ